jgi:hypothetical protein
MTNDDIKDLALANGFKLKPQPDSTEDLNPYVYQFARALMMRTAEYVTTTIHNLKIYERDFGEDADPNVIKGELEEIVLRISGEYYEDDPA